MSGVRTRQLGCKNCRVRHAKCEGGIPCRRCEWKGLSCQQDARDPFRQANLLDRCLDFTSDQVWCETTRKTLEFIDQTLETSRYYEEEQQGAEDGESSSPTSQQSNPRQSRHDRALLPDISLDDCVPPLLVADIGSPNGVFGPSPQLSILSQPASHARLSQMRGDDVDLRETLGSFMSSVGPMMDPGDQYSTLAVEIAARATTDARLLQLVRRLVRNDGNADPIVPVTDSPASVSAPNTAHTLVEAFLTRLVGGLRGSTPTSSTMEAETIRYGLNNPTMFSREDSEFAHQVMWAALRQELFLAIINQDSAYVQGIDETTLVALGHSTEEAEWTDRILLQLSRAVERCLGQSISPAVYDRLIDDLATWAASKPACFSPVFLQLPEEEEGFPEVMFLGDAAAVAAQYYHIVRILLLTHNPRMPRLGVARRDATRCMNEQVESDVKFVCGVAESRGPVHPMHLNACMGIALGGDVFRNAQDRAHLQDILFKVEGKYGWSTAAVHSRQYLNDCSEA